MQRMKGLVKVSTDLKERAQKKGTMWIWTGEQMARLRKNGNV
jgi:hypothetical protein